MAVYDVGKHTLQNIIKHVQENGVVPRQHKNPGRRPTNSLCFDDIRSVILFICNYSEEDGLSQPSAPRCRNGEAPVYLPSNTTNIAIHRAYADSCAAVTPPARVVKYSTFINTWRLCVPHIKIATPRDDICARLRNL